MPDRKLFDFFLYCKLVPVNSVNSPSSSSSSSPSPVSFSTSPSRSGASPTPLAPAHYQALNAQIEWSYPAQADSEQRFIQHCMQFCFPDVELSSGGGGGALDSASAPQQTLPPSLLLSAEDFVFVVTASDGERRYGYCRRRVHRGERLPHCICIVSRLEDSQALFEPLLEECAARLDAADEYQQLIQRCWTTPLPNDPQASIRVAGIAPRTTADEQLTLPSACQRRSLVAALLRLTRAHLCEPDVLVEAFAAMLAERRLVFTSDSLTRLSAVTHGLLALFRPLRWLHTCVPILPLPLVSFCSAPTPFFCGILNSELDALRKQPHDSLVLLDCDHSEFLTDTPDSELIAPRLRVPLLAALRGSSSANAATAQAAQDAFLLFYLQLVGNWREHRRSVDDDFLDVDRLIRSRPPAYAPLLTAICETQSFRQFVASDDPDNELVEREGADAVEVATTAIHSSAGSSVKSAGSAFRATLRRRVTKKTFRASLDESGEVDGATSLSADSTDAIADDEILKAGWLTKMGGKKKDKKWNRRWFRLSDSRLAYYGTPNDRSEKGAIALADVTYVSDRQFTHRQQRFCMELVTAERTYYVVAADQSDLSSWFSVIAETLERVNPSAIIGGARAAAVAATLKRPSAAAVSRAPASASDSASSPPPSASSSPLRSEAGAALESSVSFRRVLLEIEKAGPFFVVSRNTPKWNRGDLVIFPSAEEDAAELIVPDKAFPDRAAGSLWPLSRNDTASLPRAAALRWYTALNELPENYQSRGGWFLLHGHGKVLSRRVYLRAPDESESLACWPHAASWTASSRRAAPPEAQLKLLEIATIRVGKGKGGVGFAFDVILAETAEHKALRFESSDDSLADFPRFLAGLVARAKAAEQRRVEVQVLLDDDKEDEGGLPELPELPQLPPGEEEEEDEQDENPSSILSPRSKAANEAEELLNELGLDSI